VQKGSLVEPDRLRFDFSHECPLTPLEIKIIEQRVNQDIRANHQSIIQISTLDEAMQRGAIGLFEEKYGDQVRSVRFGKSLELCGGTHAHHTGDIGLFKIISESSVASGIRRIEAVTGAGAIAWLEQHEAALQKQIKLAHEEIRLLEKQSAQLEEKLAVHLSQTLLSQAKDVHDIKVLTAIVSDVEAKSLRSMVDQLKQKLGRAVIVLAIIKQQKITLIAGVTSDISHRLKAGVLANDIALQIGGKGGGRPDLAEAGGNNVEKLADALASVYHWVEKKWR
jgi:alanyl-tRNA synthetase